MFNRKTLVVIGAGASHEYGLPTGEMLKNRIASLLNIRFENGTRLASGDGIICDALSEAIRRRDQKARDINLYLHAGWRIREAMPLAISIDNFLDAHRGDKELELCGKLAITRAILEAERSSTLYFDQHNQSSIDFNASKEYWLNSFFQLLTENCRADDLPYRLEKIVLIIFNYDRCVEHFLFFALQTHYGINSAAAADLVRSIKIFHPYGQVGELSCLSGEHAVEFGAEPNAKELVDLSGEIRTFTEGNDPKLSDIEEIRDQLAKSNIVMFLGFAYHRLNLELIRSEDLRHSDPEATRYFGTALGISNSDCGVIMRDLSDLASARPDHIFIHRDLSCSGLFREYWRSLSLS